MAPPFRTLVDIARHAVETYPTRPLFGLRGAEGWEWLTYGAFGTRVDALRATLAARGVGAGDVVAVIAENGPAWATACYATAGLGAILVPLYPAQPAQEWAWILRDCGARCVVAEGGAILEALAAEDLPADRIQLDLAEPTPDGAPPVAAIEPDPSDRASVIYTSGTTGEPKGVVLSHANLCSNVNALHERFDLRDQTSLSFLPWAHSFGQTAELHAMVSMGNALAINDRIPNLMRNLEEVQPTLLVTVPRVLHRIRDSVRARVAERSGPVRGLIDAGVDAGYRQSTGESLGLVESAQLWAANRLLFETVRRSLGGQLKTVISGSAALDPSVARFLGAIGVHVYEGYGLTETSPVATCNHPGATRIGSVGQPLPGVTVTIDGVEGAEGEVLVRGPNVMQGYLGREEATAARFTEDGALRTGDLGRIDDDGFLWITGRLSEQYKLENGRFVVPGPVEAALCGSAYIAQAVVYGRNRPHTVALIQPDSDALRSWAREQGLGRIDLETNDRVRALLEAEIERWSQQLKPWERPGRFAVTRKAWTTENGLLTPTQKVRRKRVLSEFRDVLEALYG